MNSRSKFERGGVSIFIVVFTALLVAVVSTSFTQVMLRNQRQANNNDLSQSAYDSALAGVEDAKRALVRLKQCNLAADTSSECNKLRNALADNKKSCRMLEDAGVVTFDDQKEVPVGDASMNQAYTCVITQVATPSYEGKLEKDESVLIPLDATGAAYVSTVKLSWFTEKDRPNGVDELPQPATIPTTFPTLPASAAWNPTSPPIMRSQLIQYKAGSIDLEEFDKAGTPNASTLFLYPSIGGGNQDFSSDGRRAEDSRNRPADVECTDAPDERYACSTQLTLPYPEGCNDDSCVKRAFLQLTSLYNKANYKVELCGDAGCSPANVLDFDNVQPRVDSTGRASDLFRRVEARVALDSYPEPYPGAALQVSGDLCKNFFVTGNAKDYDPGDCSDTTAEE